MAQIHKETLDTLFHFRGKYTVKLVYIKVQGAWGNTSIYKKLDITELFGAICRSRNWEVSIDFEVFDHETEKMQVISNCSIYER